MEDVQEEDVEKEDVEEEDVKGIRSYRPTEM